MRLDWSISIGNVATALIFLVSMVVASFKLYGNFTRRATAFEDVIKEHTTTLVAHSTRMEKQDDLLLRIIGDVQRLVGRMEVNQSASLHMAANDAAAVLESAAKAAAHVLEVASQDAAAKAAAAAAAAAAIIQPRM